MGCFDIFCIVCGCPYHVLYLEDTIFTEKKYKKITNWMSKGIIITASGETITNAKEEVCNVSFVTPDGTQYECITSWGPMDLTYGYFVHKDCYQYVYNKTGKKLRYDMFIANKKEKYKQIDFNYGMIEKYWQQDFEFIKAINDKNEYIFNSPLKNNIKNNNRINKIISQFKLKKDRKGPEISASFCKNNDIRLGNDGYFWIKKNGKWTKLDIDIMTYTIKYDRKYDKILRKMVQIYESNTKTIFYRILPKNNILEFIGDSKNIELIKKKFK